MFSRALFFRVYQKLGLCGIEVKHLKKDQSKSLLPFKPLPKRQNIDSSKLKEFADHNFKFDENGRKFTKPVKNTVEKGEIACYEQFLLFPQCFQKTCTADT